jgi:hypothetical protein
MSADRHAAANLAAAQPATYLFSPLALCCLASHQCVYVRTISTFNKNVCYATRTNFVCETPLAEEVSPA